MIVHEQYLSKIRPYSDEENKIKRATTYYGLDLRKAKKEIDRINTSREKHYNHYTNMKWKDASHYDLCINVDILGPEKTAQLIQNIIKEKF